MIAIRFLAVCGVVATLFLAACKTSNTSSEKTQESDKTKILSSKWLMDHDLEGRKTWYMTPQGSFFAPMDVFLALKTDNSGDFAARENLEKYGWAYAPEGEDYHFSYKGLPLGFSEEPNPNMKGIPSVGFTCAACHTGQFVHNQVRYIVEGGQAMANVEAFNKDLTEIMAKTLADPARIAAMQKEIASKNPQSPYAKDSKRLNQDLKASTEYLQGRMERNSPAVAYGHARIDAFTEILNELLVDQVGLTERDQNGKLVNAEAPASPVSIPALWTAPDLECVQTNCISRNPLTRNLGETIGVFGRARLRVFKDSASKASGLNDVFDTTAKVENLYELEESLARLPAPRWPEKFLGPLDQELVEKGESIYRANKYDIEGKSYACMSCHVIADRNVPESLTERNAVGGQFFKVTKWTPEVVKTDLAFMDQHLNRSVSGLPLTLRAVYDVVVNKDQDFLHRFDPKTEKSAIKFLAVTTNIAIRKYFHDNKIDEATKIKYTHKHENASTFEPRMYKARPLNGIAFSAPYLHNGSVPSLDDLFKKPADRPKQFAMGTLAFNTQKVGYVYEGGQDFELGRFDFNTAIKGNMNGGHEWGTELSDSDRMALIEYLKSL